MLMPSPTSNSIPQKQTKEVTQPMRSTLRFLVSSFTQPELKAAVPRFSQAVAYADRMMEESVDVPRIEPEFLSFTPPYLTCFFDTMDELITDLFRSGIPSFDVIRVITDLEHDEYGNPRCRDASTTMKKDVNYLDVIQWLAENFEFIGDMWCHVDREPKLTIYYLSNPVADDKEVFKIVAHTEDSNKKELI